MAKIIRPGVDEAISPAHGVSRDGQPLSYNRAPAPDLAPWIARLYATKVDAPENYRLDCGLFNETAVVRVQLAGDWTAKTAHGQLSLGRAALLFGPQTQRMPISVTGSFISVGYALRPGALTVLKGPRMKESLDRIYSQAEMGEFGVWLLARLERETQPEAWLQALEEGMRIWVDKYGCGVPDPITTQFEAVAFANPSISVAQFAKDCGVGERTVERTILRDFGMSPKQVLRRSRALDMASYLRGVADRDEADELTLRYYDQSHMIREFTQLFGMSPSQFVTTAQPLMTLGLESRQARRLEAIARIAPGGARPWEVAVESIK